MSKRLINFAGLRPSIGSLWKHYNGTVYKIIEYSWCTKTQRPLVLYIEANTNKNVIFARDSEEFEELVDVPGAAKVPRFTRVRTIATSYKE